MTIHSDSDIDSILITVRWLGACMCLLLTVVIAQAFLGIDPLRPKPDDPSAVTLSHQTAFASPRLSHRHRIHVNTDWKMLLLIRYDRLLSC